MEKPERQKSGERGKKALAPAQLQAVAQLFSVLSEESRLRIVQSLQEEPLCVADVVKKSGLKQANVSKQLGILLGAGVIEREQKGNRAIYSIDLPMVFDLCEVVCKGVAKQAERRARDLSKGQ